MERIGVARLGRTGPDLRRERMVLPAIDHVGVEERVGRIRICRRHRQRLCGVQATAVVKDFLTTVVDGHGHAAGDHIVRDPPDRRIGAPVATDQGLVRRRRLECRDWRVARPAGRWHDRQDES